MFINFRNVSFMEPNMQENKDNKKIKNEDKIFCVDKILST